MNLFTFVTGQTVRKLHNYKNAENPCCTRVFGQNVVRTEGLEPTHSSYKILSLARLPIPPRPQNQY